MLCLRQLFTTDGTESIECGVYALFWYILFSVFRKIRLILLCISLEICLYHLRLWLVCLQLPALNCVIARQEKSWVLFSCKNRHLCWFGTQQPYWLSPSTTIIFYKFFQKCFPDYTYPSTALKLFPEIWSGKVRNFHCFYFSKTWKHWSIRNFGMNFWTVLLLNMSLMNSNKVRFLVKTPFPNWDRHGKDILGRDEECLRNEWIVPECSSIST